MKIYNRLWTLARMEALKVDFLETMEELRMYASALYLAMVWGESAGEGK